MRVWHLLDLDRRAIFNLAPLEVRNLIASLSIPRSWLPQRHMDRGCEYGGFALGCSTSLTESVELSPLGPGSQRIGAALAVSGEEARQHTQRGTYRVISRGTVGEPGQVCPGSRSPREPRGSRPCLAGPHGREAVGQRSREAERGAEGCHSVEALRAAGPHRSWGN